MTVKVSIRCSSRVFILAAIAILLISKNDILLIILSIINLFLGFIAIIVYERYLR